ncbi:hypothetical protein [Francisella frigiditurris]|uniref:Uncharacterized protein n=1 Tax=Francisella frigiditurris TaxID=1542390 RepID=A0A1J0KTG2_9GAMM|nr:hypothetical protein [Francisella frigiditurris]APC96986.1 hypothetical protein KX01_275 [Francisella frigiditurris]
MKKILFTIMVILPMFGFSVSVTDQITNNGVVQSNIDKNTVNNAYSIYKKWRSSQEQSEDPDAPQFDEEDEQRS